MPPPGNRFTIHEMSTDYGERRYAVEDLALTRDNLVRDWRQKGQGRVTVAGIKPPKIGMIWRGTQPEATSLCEALNSAYSRGSTSPVSDPPKRENAVQWAKHRNGAATKTRPTPAPFYPCETCHTMVKKEHQCPT